MESVSVLPIDIIIALYQPDFFALAVILAVRYCQSLEMQLHVLCMHACTEHSNIEWSPSHTYIQQLNYDINQLAQFISSRIIYPFLTKFAVFAVGYKVDIHMPVFIFDWVFLSFLTRFFLL